ncbi:MAG: chemotaxis response regulator protein-glutamate methylesterase [Deltaproteobacteria bacterium]|nr:chemotaxis response regulator protein-glutamate methylesterase [Deltaproteobacteria bacterium]
MTPIRVLVVDDSMFMRNAIQRILGGTPDVEVVGFAVDGVEAVEKCVALRPDVITMDVKMPRKDGVAATREIMAVCPTPILMLSAFTQAGAQATVEALSAGAVDFLPKPSGEVSTDLAELAADLTNKVRIVAKSRIRMLGAVVRLPAGPATQRRVRAALSIVGIGVSTGGPSALAQIIPRLPNDFLSAIAIVQHMPGHFTEALARELSARSDIAVREARSGDQLEPGVALIAPGGYHMKFDAAGRVRLDQSAEVNGCRPSVDVMFQSLARVFGAAVTGVILTGMGRDGALGLRAIRDAGGETIAQDEESSVVYGMPRAAIEANAATRVLPLDDIADFLVAKA